MTGYDFNQETQVRSLEGLKAPIVGKDVIIEIHVPDTETPGNTILVYRGQYTDVSRYHNSRIVEYVETGYATPLNIATNYSFGGTLAKGDVDDVLSQLAFGTKKLTRSGGRHVSTLGAGVGASEEEMDQVMIGADRDKLASPEGATALAEWQLRSRSSMTANPYVLKLFKGYSSSRQGESGEMEEVTHSLSEGRCHVYGEVTFSNFRAISNAGSDIATHVVDWYASSWEIQELI